MGLQNPEADWSTLKVTDLKYNTTRGLFILVAVDNVATPTRRVEVALPSGSLISDKPV